MSRGCAECGGVVEAGWLVCADCRELLRARDAAAPAITAAISAFAERLAAEIEARAAHFMTEAVTHTLGPADTERAVVHVLIFREIAALVRKAAT